MTGKNGFIGKILATILQEQGHEIVSIYLDSSKKYFLGDDVDVQDLAQFDYFIHSAHDFDACGRSIFKTNFLGAISLLSAVHRCKIPILFISSLAAHSSTKSWYGYTKLCLENSVSLFGGNSVRLGVLPLELEGNKFAKLVKGGHLLRFVLCPGNKRTFFYMTKLEDIERCLYRFIKQSLSPGKTYKVASSRPLAYRELFPRRTIIFLYLPLLYGFLKFFEIITNRNFKSDSLLSLKKQINSAEFHSLDYA